MKITSFILFYLINATLFGQHFLIQKKDTFAVHHKILWEYLTLHDQEDKFEDFEFCGFFHNIYNHKATFQIIEDQLYLASLQEICLTNSYISDSIIGVLRRAEINAVYLNYLETMIDTEINPSDLADSLIILKDQHYSFNEITTIQKHSILPGRFANLASVYSGTYEEGRGVRINWFTGKLSCGIGRYTMNEAYQPVYKRQKSFFFHEGILQKITKEKRDGTTFN